MIDYRVVFCRAYGIAFCAQEPLAFNGLIIMMK